MHHETLMHTIPLIINELGFAKVSIDLYPREIRSTVTAKKLSLVDRVVVDSFLDALISRTDDLALAVELFDAVSGPTGDSRDSEEGSVELHRDSEH